MIVACEYSAQARVTVLSEGVVLDRIIAPAPIEWNLQTYSPPWDTRARFTICNAYGCNTNWAFDSGGRTYLRAPFSNFRIASGASGPGIFFDQAQDRGVGRSPAPPYSALPITTWNWSYETPTPPPNRWVLTWRSTSVAGSDRVYDRPKAISIDVECSCDSRSYIQCGDMSESNYCCLSCDLVNSQLLSLKNAVNGLTRSLTSK